MLDDIYKNHAKELCNNHANIIVSDINQAMLDVGKRRAEQLGISQSELRSFNKRKCKCVDRISNEAGL